MKESIYTIPISEVFEPRKGCPICALQEALETRWVGYITGAAMMEPDVRLRTNEEGFCGPHLEAMLAQRNRLSVALLLQTRLDHLLQQTSKRQGGSFSLVKKKKPEHTESCFVCNRVRSELDRLLDNLTAVWEREPAFQELFREQEHVCFPHHSLLTGAGERLRGSSRTLFLEACDALLRQGLLPAKENIDAFCKLFDHRASGESRPEEAVSQAVEGAGVVLCGNKFDIN